MAFSECHAVELKTFHPPPYCQHHKKSWPSGTGVLELSGSRESGKSGFQILLFAFETCVGPCMHLSGIGSNVQRFLLRSHCPLTAAAPAESLFQALFTSIYIYMPFTWDLKSRHCVFTQSITCSLLTFDTNLTFLSISSVTPRRDRRGCVISRLMTRLAGYYAQLSLMMIGIDAISHGFLRTSFRNGRGPPAPAASQGKNVRSRSVNNNFQPLLHSPHPFSKDWWYFDWYFLNIRSAAVWCAQMGWQWPKYHRQQCFPP